MKDKEKVIGNMLTNFPNFIHRELHGRKFTRVNEFGGVNVCVREGQIPECNGRVDLAWVTDTTIHLAELKRYDITIDALEQFRRYYQAVRSRYPNHRILGYLIGYSCQAVAPLQEAIGSEPIRIMRLGIEIPMLGQVIRCRDCGAGLWSHKPVCPFCRFDIRSR